MFDVRTMYNPFNIEFIQALNPLYALPIVAVILCAFIVYAFGFKSPVQPPSFEGIEEEKKFTRKRKAKETSKQGKVIQNGKLNGSASNKPHISPPGKKKDLEKSADKPVTEKSSTNERKATKKAKPQNDKKNIREKKKETVANEDNAEDGWVQLISKKGRKSRKKDEASSTENQSVGTKPIKISEVGKSDESSPSEESCEKVEISVESAVPEKTQPIKEEKSKKKKEVMNELSKPTLKEEKSKKKEVKEERNVYEVVSNTENNKEKVQADNVSLEKIPSKEIGKSEKLIEESSNKSKKKKKKNAEIINTDNESLITISEPPPVQLISEPSTDMNAAIDSTVTVETSQVVSDKIEGKQPKESKSSNVMFDELAGLYPEAKEQRKKKKVRRDH